MLVQFETIGGGQLGDQGRQRRVGVDRLHFPAQGIGLGLAAGVEFQQVVAAVLQGGVGICGELVRLREQQRQVGLRGVPFQRLQQGRLQAFEYAVAGGARGGKGVQAVPVPVEQVGLGAGLQVRHVDADGLALADAVEAADALLQQVRVQGQVEQDQVVGELEVASLAADLGADQQTSPLLRVGKPGRGTVALQQAHAFVEQGGLDASTTAQGLFQLASGLGPGADQQQLGAVEPPQQIEQPGQARVERPPGFGWALGLIGPLRGQQPGAGGHFGIGRGDGQRRWMQFPRREAAHRGTRIPK